MSNRIVIGNDEISGQPIFFSYQEGGFSSIDWLSLPFADDEPIYDNYLAHKEEQDAALKATGKFDQHYCVGAKPADYTRVWGTVGDARASQIESQKPPMTFTQFVNAMADARGISALELMDIDAHGGSSK